MPLAVTVALTGRLRLALRLAHEFATDRDFKLDSESFKFKLVDSELHWQLGPGVHRHCHWHWHWPGRRLPMSVAKCQLA